MRRGWKTVLTFISGMVFGELSSDFTDFIYFTYYKDVSAETAPLVWYWLTASWYMVLFAVAYVIARLGIVRPEHFVYFMMFLAALGGYLSWRALSSSASPAYLLFVLGIPTAVSLGILWGLKRRVE